MVSLITWHADDPSFSYSADAQVAHFLGFPGAAFADLAMDAKSSGQEVIIRILWGKLMERLDIYPADILTISD